MLTIIDNIAREIYRINTLAPISISLKEKALINKALRRYLEVLLRDKHPYLWNRLLTTPELRLIPSWSKYRKFKLGVSSLKQAGHSATVYASPLDLRVAYRFLGPPVVVDIDPKPYATQMRKRYRELSRISESS